MEIKYLTPDQLQELDPSGKGQSKWEQYPYSGPGYYADPSKFFSADAREKLIAYVKSADDKLSGTRHHPYVEFNREHYALIGPQGGAISQEDLMVELEAYYQIRPYTPSTVVHDGMDYIRQRIRDYLACNPMPSVCYQPVRGTFAGLPSCSEKGSFDAETMGMKPWRHVLPAIPGQRRMRQKNRVIFMTPCPDVRYIEHTLYQMKVLLQRALPEFFDAWSNPIFRRYPLFREMAGRRDVWSIEIDYVKMDRGVSILIVDDLLLPLYQEFIPGCDLSFSNAIEETFQRPLLCGNKLLTGEHAMFSGEAYTNDFETIYSVALVLGTLLHMDLLPNLKGLYALGDDSTVLLKTSRRLAEKCRDVMIEESRKMGMYIHEDEKTRVSNTDIRFCREIFYPGMPNRQGRGVYPASLTVNNILYPERPSATAGVAACADLARLDGAVEVPYYHDLVTMFASLAQHEFLKSIDGDSLARFQKLSDWWERLYGEKWTPTSSYTFNVLQS